MEKQTSRSHSSDQRICLLQLRQLGDIILTTPAIRWIKRSMPRSELDVLTHPMGRLILANNKYVSKNLEYSTEGLVPLFKNLMSLRRRPRYQFLVDLMCHPRSAFLANILPAEQRVGFETNRSIFYSRVLPRRSGQEYIGLEKIRFVCDALGLAYPDDHDESLRLDFVWTEADLSPMKELSATSSPNPIRIVISPTNRREERKWTRDGWQSYARWLVGLGVDVLWVWGPGEKDEVQDLWEQSGKSGGLAPRTNLRELAAIIANSDLFVSGSNGPSHIAVAVNTPSLQLHGPTQALSWCPNTARHRFVQNTVTQDIPIKSVQLETESLLRSIRQKNRSPILNHMEVWTHRPSLAIL